MSNTYPWRTVSGNDFGRANISAKADDRVIWRPFTRILIISHSQTQMDIFVRNYKIPREKTHRVTEAIQLYGIEPTDPSNIMFLLPEYARTIHESLFSGIHRWVNLKGKHAHLTDAQVLRKSPAEK